MQNSLVTQVTHISQASTSNVHTAFCLTLSYSIYVIYSPTSEHIFVVSKPVERSFETVRQLFQASRRVKLDIYPKTSWFGYLQMTRLSRLLYICSLYNPRQLQLVIFLHYTLPSPLLQWTSTGHCPLPSRFTHYLRLGSSESIYV